MSRTILLLFHYKTYDLSSLHMVLFEIGVGIFHLKYKKKAAMTSCLTESDQLDIEKKYVVRLRLINYKKLCHVPEKINLKNDANYL